MELIGALLIVLALVLLVAVYLAGPFLKRTPENAATHKSSAEVDSIEHKRSSLLAERDRILTALQELDFDHEMGKVPDEDYPTQRSALLMQGTRVLRQLDAFEPAAGTSGTAADRIEAAVAAHRADAVHRGSSGQVKAAGRAASATTTPGGKDDLEEMIALRKRERKESAAGFCPRCGRPAQKSDKFCSKCGATL